MNILLRAEIKKNSIMHRNCCAVIGGRTMSGQHYAQTDLHTCLSIYFLIIQFVNMVLRILVFCAIL